MALLKIGIQKRYIVIKQLGLELIFINGGLSWKEGRVGGQRVMP